MKYLFDSEQDDIDKRNNQYYGEDNPFNGSDDDEGGSNYDRYKQGWDEATDLYENGGYDED